jgi:hypothetical protein
VLGDLYPLTPYSVASDAWMGFQFDRPELGEGTVLVFRRSGSEKETSQFKLRGLTPNAVYAVTDLDSGSLTEVKGRDLMDKGLSVTIKERPGSALLAYSKKRG